MTNRIAESLQSTRAALRRAAVLRGLSLAVAVLVGAVIVVGCLDWAVHFDGRNTRLTLAIAVGVSVVAAITWWVVLPAITGLSDFCIARRIEATHPEFSGRLSNSVEFLEQACEGSEQLQQHAIATAADSLSQLSPEQLVDRSPLRVASSLALLLVTLGLILFATNPVEASTAVSRLVFPFRSIPWPRTTDLRVIDDAGNTLPRDEALTVVRGEMFEVLAENTRGKLPDNSVIEHRVGTRGKSRFEPMQPIALESSNVTEVGRTMLTPASGPVFFRAIGGDHWSPWYRLDVVSPPTLSDVEIEVIPPEYLGGEPEILPEGSDTMEALVGSRIRVAATTSKPIQSAAIEFQDRTEPVEVEESRREIQAEFALDKEGIFSWTVELTDTTEIRDPRPIRYEVRVKADSPPDVFIDQPSNDRQVTAEAVLPITAVASDDQGVQSMRLEVVDSAGTTDTLATADISEDSGSGDATIEAELDLAELGAKPGQQFVLQAVAADSYDVDGETHIVSSAKRTLNVVTAEAKAMELATRQTQLLTELDRIADAQTKTHDSLKELQIQNRETGVLRRVDLDLLKRTELDQQRIRASLFDDTDGLRQRAFQLAGEFEQNKLEQSEAHMQVDELLGELAHVQERIVSALEVQLSMARKDAEEALTESGSVDVATVPNLDPNLENIGQLQTEIIDSLRSILVRTAGWKRRTDLLSSLTEIAGQQDQLIRDTNRLGDLTLAGATDSDRKQIKSDSARVALRQERLAETFDSLLEEIATHKQSEELNALQQLSVITNPGLKMRQAASELKSGRTAVASQLESEAARILGEFIDLLRQSPDAASAELDGIRKLEAAIQSLAARENEIGKLLKAGAEAQGLVIRQAELRRQMQRHVRQLARQNAPNTTDAANRANNAVQAAETGLRSSSRDQAGKSISAAVAALDQLVAEIRKRQQILQADSTRAAVNGSIALLRNMASRQTVIRDDTRRFESELKQTGRRTRKQSREVLTVARKQGTLADEVEQLRGELDAVEVVPLLLTAISDHMRGSERRLSRRVTDSQTVESQQAAARELLALADSLKESASDLTNSDLPPGQSGSVPVAAQSKLVPLLTRLRLIRSLQQSVASATRKLSERDSTAEERQKLERRQNEVARLAQELLLNLSKEEGK